MIDETIRTGATEEATTRSQLTRSSLWVLGCFVLFASLFSAAAVELQDANASLNPAVSDAGPLGDGNSSGPPSVALAGFDTDLVEGAAPSRELAALASSSDSDSVIGVLFYAPKTSPPSRFIG